MFSSIKKTLRVMSALVGMAVSGHTLAQFANQAELNEFAKNTTFQFSIINNYADADGAFFEAAILLTNDSGKALPAGVSEWEMYFHLVRPILHNDHPGVSIEHIQGDFHVIKPTAEFKGLAIGQTLTLPFRAKAHIATYGEMMPRAFITKKGLQPAIFANTDVETPKSYVLPITEAKQYQRYVGDQYPVANAASRYAENQPATEAAASLKSDVRILPTPKFLRVKGDVTTVDNSWGIHYAGSLTSEADYLSEQLKPYALTLEKTTDKVAGKKVIQLRADASVGESESYRLVIDKESIVIVGADAAGVFYGIQSLLSAAPAATQGAFTVPRLDASDEPRYSWRGMHYDMARNFHGKAAVLQLIEQMGRYKLNKLHLHLVEDEGWRLEIPGLPELTDVGAFRCFDLTEQTCLLPQLGSGPFKTAVGNGYYSRADFIEILAFAKARHIEVIPEIDMPGHSRAAIKSMEARYQRLMKAGKKTEAEYYLLSDPKDQSVYKSVQSYSDNAANVCLQSTYNFVEKVTYELQQMYREAGATLSVFHMGGDEVGRGAWTNSPACQALMQTPDSGVVGVADLKPYFVKRVAEITHARGLDLMGWEDGLMYDFNNTFNRESLPNKRVIANAWDNIWEAGVADRAHRLANNDYQVVLSSATHLYFDHPYEAHPEEFGYYWATRYTGMEKLFNFMPDNLYANADRTHAGAEITDLEALVRRPLPPMNKPHNMLGIQGQLWSETVRTQAVLEQMIFPRLAVVSERAWHKAAWESDAPSKALRLKDYVAFSKYMTEKELPKLAAAGVTFYLPAPGATVENGKLMANTALPGLAIEISVDNGKSWVEYQPEQMLEGKASLRTRVGNIVSRTTEVDAHETAQ